MRPGGYAVVMAAALATAAAVPGWASGARGAALPAPAATAPAAPRGMVWIPAGSYLPLYRLPDPDGGPAAAPRRVNVDAFLISEHPVTNAEFLAFVREHPEWRRSAVKRIHADEGYLRHWAGDLEPGELAPPESPVTHVSWFAARAWCRSRGLELPTIDQWEYVAAASETRRDASREPRFQDRIREWYARPAPRVPPPVRSTVRNAYGVWDLHGLVWEWALDFDAALVTGESRGDGTPERSLFCGGAAAGAADYENYPAFMRDAFRSSLQARYTVATLGFRGVRAAPADAGAR